MPSCAEAGVIGVIPGIIGLMQANEAIKWICKLGDPLVGRLLIYDALSARLREIKIKKEPSCPLCGTHPTIRALEDYVWHCADNPTEAAGEITVRELKQLRDKKPDLYLLDVREQAEWDIARIEGAHLKPLSILKNDFEDIPKEKPVYCFCKAGGRSAKAIEFLRSKGYLNLVNVKGGIQAWSEEIDRAIAQY
jgi:adenylyltransferase/sulfurtransferase